MAKSKATKLDAGAKSAATVSSEEKIARLLGLMMVKDIEEKRDQVVLLRTAGFEVSEVATLLGISANNVSVAALAARKKKKSPKRGSR